MSVVYHIKFDSLQYLTIWSIAFHKPLLVNDDTTRSSANSTPGISSSSYQWNMRTAYIYTFCNKQGLKLHPCLTPLLSGVNSLTQKALNCIMKL